ncbi:unnamed protein product [Zymoseptoria tritici ST99CH_1A5]|uniref:Uncharacterized protein n=4 Tax=Zymoseptoria tritici TaxID=1047171 RepID=F9XLD3_ZYMTI|nr:uncharacterized protein MYCGRDRAFT_110974 [Zymoseptoria tritici IPO323]SMQ54565.1 unnamed protein product [Zymoseptoria tritici ST99CH_3D7]SMR59004.1 unnamed protein product [Zymoseptoria tritici ST99CH_1E4]SMR62845.1 unnamed protein product [Zymoseptoria tritici ST99CH_3D1]SMY28215.1 unnamed protein product [Zymoseptoria tritici ST99CH_1A5]EGP84158.1 hypothetical protein MYCGRDRAFT_110974 [Zymoseptoria tritici IPO323]
MSAGNYAASSTGKTSSDSGPSPALDRWSQRRLQRLNTEQGFREQRQGGGSGSISTPPLPTGGDHQQQQHAPPTSSHSSRSYSNSGGSYAGADLPPALPSAPPQAAQPGYQQLSRTGSQPSAGLNNNNQTQSSRAPQYQDPQPQYSPTDHNARPGLTSTRSFTQQSVTAEESTSMSNHAPMPAQKPAGRSTNGNNRQSVHSGMMSRDGQTQNYKTEQVGRGTPQPAQSGEEMSEEEVTQLVKDHKELREKYTKVKKYYFEKEDQVKQLQNSLAHQRLSQSRTSLDDSEYTTRFNRLDGLIAQLAFSIRKSWKSIPQWLVTSVNRDAVATGKQEMTAAGRAFISYWLVEEVFEKYFHPDLDPAMSIQLRQIQRNMRRYAPLPQTAEEEEYLTSKVVNWRLATLEGLTDALRAPQCPENRQRLTDTLKDSLVAAIATHLTEPTPSDLEGGVHMIVELVVSIAIHLPLESRDVVIEYYTPGHPIMPDNMKLESGIPPLTTSVADEVAERSSLKSANSDVVDLNEGGGSGENHPSKKRSMLSALTGSGGKNKIPSAQGKHTGAAGSSSSLGRPESASGHGKEPGPPRVRMAAGIAVSVRGRTVLVKAPVFGTS